MFGISWLDPQTLITSLGAFAIVVVLIMVFAETGLLIGFFLPGDSLLFITGLMVSSSVIELPIWLVCAMISTTAFLGDPTG